MTPRKLYRFFIDEELDAGLKALKKRDGMPEAEAIRRALAEFLTKKRIPLGKSQAAPRRASTRRRA